MTSAHQPSPNANPHNPVRGLAVPGERGSVNIISMVVRKQRESHASRPRVVVYAMNDSKLFVTLYERCLLQMTKEKKRRSDSRGYHQAATPALDS